MTKSNCPTNSGSIERNASKFSTKRPSNDTGFVKAVLNAPISLVNLSPRTYVHTHAIEVANNLDQFELGFLRRAINRKSFFRRCAVSAIINFQSNAGSSSRGTRQKHDDDAPRLSRATRKWLRFRGMPEYFRESVPFLQRIRYFRIKMVSNVYTKCVFNTKKTCLVSLSKDLIK